MMLAYVNMDLILGPHVLKTGTPALLTTKNCRASKKAFVALYLRQAKNGYTCAF